MSKVTSKKYNRVNHEVKKCYERNKDNYPLDRCDDCSNRSSCDWMHAKTKTTSEEKKELGL